MHGCENLRQGAKHTIWHNPPAHLRTPVPRHREIPSGTAPAMLTTRDPSSSGSTLTNVAG
ncbi:MAG: type II toxin-antitoxin system HicA family toxin [Actinomycetota bacterium]|nr:type II toxin-antitoxin system HicA family toxin [Actinomycetota bacterium]